jgi:Zn-dependent protease with chaperone function
MHPQPPSLPRPFPMSPASERSAPPPHGGALVAAGPMPLPPLRFGDAPVDATQQVAAGTNRYLVVGYVAVVVGLLVATVASMGAFLGLLLMGAIAAWFQMRRARALIRGSGLAVGPAQLPEVHHVVEQFAKRLGLKETPEVYIVEDSVQNGFAVKIGKKNTILLTDDVVWGALQSRDPRALGFIIGHELAHFALNHTGALRGTVRNMFPPLKRADEFSADNVAAALVGDARVAVHGLAVLTVGPQLLHYLNDEALLEQAREVDGLKLSKKVEKTMTHPLILRRIANVAKRA